MIYDDTATGSSSRWLGMGGFANDAFESGRR